MRTHRFSPVLLILMLVTFTASPALAQQVLGEDEKPLRTISVTGTVTKKIMPDVIVWQIVVTDTDPDIERAGDANEKSIRNVLEVADDLDIVAEDIETGVLEMQRVFERDRFGNKVVFRHFEVKRTVFVRQRDLERFDEFYKSLIKATEVEVSFSLESSRIEAVRYETRLEALRTAKKKAADLAKVVDAKLGPVLTIQEAYTPVMPRYNARAANMMMAMEAAPGGAGGGGGGEADAESGTFAPGAIEVKVTVHATFELQ